MINKVVFPLVMALALFNQGCNSTTTLTTTSNPAKMGELIIAEPLPVNYKSEIAIARLSEVLTRVQISEEQRAQLFYDRGVLFDSVGLRSLARLDFSRALQLKPNLVDAYNFLGIHYTQMQEFSQAYEQFDSALELAPLHEYAYLNRGIALYYGARPELAVQDFEAFHHQQLDDPYRILWLYLTEHEVDAKQAIHQLNKRIKNVDDRTWAKQVIKMYIGELSQQEFINSLTYGVETNKQLTDRLCEAYFYLGKYNQILGDELAAANFFKLSLSTNVYEFVEHRYAKLELDLMSSTKALSTVP